MSIKSPMLSALNYVLPTNKKLCYNLPLARLLSIHIDRAIRVVYALYSE